MEPQDAKSHPAQADAAADAAAAADAVTNAPAVGVTPDKGAVEAEHEVSTHGITVNDPGHYRITLTGSADLAATLMDADGVTVSSIEDNAGANPLALEADLSPGAYTLHVRAARKGGSSTVAVDVQRLGA